MTFSELMNGLFKVKELFPSMEFTPRRDDFGIATVTITIRVTEENAQLLLDAQSMFAPRDEFTY